MLRKSINSERGTIYYWINEKEEKHCRSIVFSHGLTADHTLFDHQLKYWGKDYRIITWDYPLHGESKNYIGFTYDNVCIELKSILEKEGIHKVILVGQSAGGYISQAFYLLFPHMVEAFIGIGTNPFGKSYYTKTDLFWIKHYSKIAGLMPYNYYCSLGARAVTFTEEARKNMHSVLCKLEKKGMLKAADGVYGEFLKRKEPIRFKCPVLLTYGKQDNTGKVKEYNNEWSRKENLPLAVIDNAAHNANYDNYIEFNRIMKEFLEANPGA